MFALYTTARLTRLQYIE